MNKRQQRKLVKKRLRVLDKALRDRAFLAKFAETSANYLRTMLERPSFMSAILRPIYSSPPYKEWRLADITHLVTVPGYLRLCDYVDVDSAFTTDHDTVTCIPCIAKDRR